MPKISVALVGMHFRPPAKEVLSVLPLGTSLILQPEPENQYDMNAVAVLIDMPGEFPVHLFGLLDAVLPKTPGSLNAHDICGGGLFHLGYLATSGRKTAQGGPGNVEALLVMSAYDITAKLGSAPAGYPTVEISYEE